MNQLKMIVRNKSVLLTSVEMPSTFPFYFSQKTVYPRWCESQFCMKLNESFQILHLLRWATNEG